MEWRDEGILLWVRRHGESSVIIEALTREHGRHAGLIRGGASKKQAAILQPGAQLSLEWSARLAEHLGTYKADLVRSRAAAIMTDRHRLAAMNVISTLLVQFLPEREPNHTIYEDTLDLLDMMGDEDPAWPGRYALWELALLEALGFGLDLATCAATGRTQDLAYVSPRSGRAVSREAGSPFADRMLPLPAFLTGRGNPKIADVREALRTTGYFLENWVCPSYEIQSLPDVRERLVRLLERLEIAAQPAPEAASPSYSAEEIAWLAKFDSAPGSDG